MITFAFQTSLFLALFALIEPQQVAVDPVFEVTSPNNERTYPPNQRLYVTIKLHVQTQISAEGTQSAPHATSTRASTCVHIDSHETPSWCGEVSSDATPSHETIYLSGYQTAALGEGAHALTLRGDPQTLYIFTIEQPTMEISSFGSPATSDDGASSLSVSLTLRNVNPHNPYDYCLLVDFIPTCFPVTSTSEQAVTIKNLPKKIKTVISPAILDRTSNKVVHFGKIYNLVSDADAASSNSVNPFQLYIDDIDTTLKPNPRNRNQTHTHAHSASQKCKDAALTVPMSWRSIACALPSLEWGVYSQNGEDGVLLFLLLWVFGYEEIKDVKYLEFGAEDGGEVNTRLLRELGATGVLFDRSYENPKINLFKHAITPWNINNLLTAHSSTDIAVLSLDIDFNDYHVLKAMVDGGVLNLDGLKLIICEYNSHLDPTEKKTVPYSAEPGRGWDGESRYFGASLGAFVDLLGPKGFRLVHCDGNGVNAFFVNMAKIEAGWQDDEFFTTEEIFRPPNFYNKGWSYPDKVGENVWQYT